MATISNAIEPHPEADPVDDPAVWVLHNYNNEGALQVLSDRPNGVATGQNSGYQAVNIAFLAGASRIILLGFDMKAVEGKKHWFGDHPVPTHEGIFPSMLTHFSRLAPELERRGVKVINCTPDSALSCFRKAHLDATLASLLSDPPAAGVPA